MLALIWATLLLAADAGEKENPPEVSISLPNTTLTAEEGLCIFVPCFLNVTGEVKSITWYKCDRECNQTILTSDNKEVDSKFKGRVSLVNEDPKKKNCNITINNVTKDDTGSYQVNISIKGTETALTAKVNISVTALTTKPSLVVPRLVAGQTATLTCIAPSHQCQASPRITWTWRNGSKDAIISGNITKSETESPTTLTFNVSAEHDNTEVACEVRFNGGATIKAVHNLSLSTFSDSSKCTRQSDVLTCVCVIEGPARPTIEWPELQNRSRYSLLTIMSDQKVNSTITVSSEGLNLSHVQCVIDNVSEQLKVVDVFQEEDVLSKFLRSIRQLQVIVAFLVGLLLGIILTSLITCLARKCRRKKSHTLTDDLQMMDAGRSAEGEKTGAGGEVEYSDINFSALKVKDGPGAEAPAAETEYAEIKKEVVEAGDAGEEAEAALEGGEEGNVMMGGEEGTRAPAEEEGGEEVALYSNINEIMVEI